MAKYVDKTIDIKNEAVEKANEVIEVTQKDNFKHFQRINRSVLESQKQIGDWFSKNQDLQSAINQKLRHDSALTNRTLNNLKVATMALAVLNLIQVLMFLAKELL